MNINYKHLCVLALLFCASINTSVAQNDEVSKAMLLISYKKTTDSNKRGQINLAGEEAYRFDVANFLSTAPYEDIQINGGATLNYEKHTWHFQSKDLPVPRSCNNFIQVVTEVEKSPFLGVSVVPMEDFSGVRITNVVADTPGELYGFQVDDIITVINDYEVYTPCDLTTIINESQPDQLVNIDILRNDQLKTIQPLLGYRLKKKLTWKPSCEEKLVDLNDNNTGNFSNGELSIFPNPTGSTIQIKFTTSDDQTIQMHLTDLTGKVLVEKTIADFKSYFTEVLDLTSYPEGIYFLNIIQGKTIKTQKVVLQKHGF